MNRVIDLIPKKDMVRKLPFGTRKKICDELDVEKPFVKDCRDLARQIGMKENEINIIWKGRGAGRNLSPTDNVLSWWEVRNDATVMRLVEILSDMERDDVVEIFTEGYKTGTATITGNVFEFKCSNFSLFYFPFSPYLQSTQNVWKQWIYLSVWVSLIIF